MWQRISILMFVLFACACVKGGGSAPGPDREAREAVEEDQRQVGDAFKEGDRREAAAWLGSPETIMFKGDKRAALELTQRLYQAGAVSVDVIGVEKLEGREIADIIAVTLPADKARRAALFAIVGESYKGTEILLVPDLGQTYLRVSFD